jgi:peptidoglycan/xylan/chitin deacetylase (PgdA/CDA1 family)
MRVRGIGRAQQAARWIRNRFTSRALILLYHRVVELPFGDPYLLCVAPEHFAEHLEILRSYWRPLRLQQLVQALRAGNLPHRAVVVTFDDGYADNLHNAKPLLERYDIPATAFVTAGYIGGEREFWWDELERLLLQPGTLPGTLCLNVNGNSYQWALGEAAHYSEDDCRRHRCWKVGQKDNPGPRQHLHRSLHQLLHALPEGERRKVLDELLAWAGIEPLGRPTHRTLLHDEVVHMAEDGLVEVGAHTVTHPVLATCPVTAQRDEIRRSKASLEDILGCEVTSFSYPHGSYTPETVVLLREAGFTQACSSIADVVWQSTDGFQLPRRVVKDWDGEAFARRLEEWFSG